MASVRYQPLWIAATTAAGTSWDTPGAAQPLRVLLGAGRIVRALLVLPPGSEGDLHLVPRLRTAQGDVMPLSAFAGGSSGDQYLSGDDVTFPMECDLTYGTGDRLELWYDNTDQVNDHWTGLLVTVLPGGG